MQEIKSPKPVTESKTIQCAQRSDWVFYSIILAVFAGSVAFAYIPREHQLKVSLGGSIAIGVLARLGITFNGKVKQERIGFGDLISAGELTGKHLIQVSTSEKAKLEKDQRRVQNSAYVPKV